MALFKVEFLQQECPCSQEPLRKNLNSLKCFLKMGTLSRRTSTVPLYLACAGPYRTFLPLHQRLTKNSGISLAKKPQSKPHKKHATSVVPSYKRNGIMQCVVIISALIPILSILHVSTCCKFAMQCYCWGRTCHEIRPNSSIQIADRWQWHHRTSSDAI